MSEETYKQENCVCPYCLQINHIFIGSAIEDSTEICYYCKKEFLCHTDFKYSTFKKEEL